MAIIGNLISNLKLNTAEFTSGLNSAQQALGNFGKMATRAGSQLTQMVTLPLVGAAAGVVKFGSDFESAFAGVKKTVDATPEGFAKIQQGLRDMSKEIPASAAELSGIAEIAGQLGISGVDNILEFTRVTQEMADSTVLTAEAAATGMAQFMNMTADSGESVRDLGNVIVKLGNNFATTEEKILSMAQRFGGTATTVGVTRSEVFAFATALSSVGIEAEAGGTAISKAFAKMDSAVATGSANVSKFAQIAGMSTEQFAQAFRENAADAMTEFLLGLQAIIDSGQSVTPLLDSMGMKSVRLSDMLKRASIGGGELTEALEMARTEIQGGNALAEEAAKRYETFDSQLKILKNSFMDVFITLFQAARPILIDVLKATRGFVENALVPMANAFAALPEPVRLVIVGIGAMVAAAGPLLLIAGKVAFALENVMALTGSGVGLFTKLGAKLGGMTGILSKLTPWLGRVASIFTGPVGWIVGIGTLIPLIADLTGNSEAMGKIWDALARIGKAAIDILVGSFWLLVDAVQQAYSYVADTRAWQVFVEAVQWAWDGVKRFVGWLLDKAGVVLGWIADKLEWLASWFNETTDETENAVEALKTLKPEVEDNSKSVEDLKNKLTRVVPSLEGFSGATDEAKEKVKKLTDEEKKAAKIAEMLADAQWKLKKATHGGAFAFKDQMEGLESLDGKYHQFSDTTYEAIGNLRKQKEEMDNVLVAISEMHESGFNLVEIQSSLGISWESLKEKALELGIEIPETTMAIIDLGIEAKKTAKESEDLADTWKKTMADIWSKTAQALGKVITGARSFSEAFKGIFKTLGGSMVEIMSAYITKPMMGHFQNFFGGFQTKMKGWTDGLTNKLTGWLGGLGNTMGNMLGGIIGGLGDMLTGGLASLATWGIQEGITWLGNKIKDWVVKDPFKSGSKEILRDFGITGLGEEDISGFVSQLGLSKDQFKGIRKDVLSSPLAFQKLLLPLAQATGQVDKLVASFKNFTAFGKTWDLSAAAAQAAAGDMSAFNQAFMEIWGNQKTWLDDVLPNWKELLVGIKDTAQDPFGAETGSETDDWLNELNQNTETAGKVVDTVSKGMDDLVAKLTDVMDHISLKFDDLFLKIEDMLAGMTGNFEVGANSVLAGLFGGGASNGTTLNVTVNSRSEDLVATVRSDLIPLLKRELEQNTQGLGSSVVKAVLTGKAGVTSKLF